MSSQERGAVRESRHLWVGGLPDSVTEEGIKEYFSKFGKIEGVKILPQKFPNIGVAAFVDFYDVQSAIKTHNFQHQLGGNDLRTNFKAKVNESYRDKRKRMNDSSEKARRDLQEAQGRSSSSSGSDTDDSSSSSYSSSDTTNGRKSSRRGANEISTLFLKVSGLANRPERILQDGLYYEFCRYSPKAVVRMYGNIPEKLFAVVKYNRVESCRKAIDHSQGMVLFGSKLKLVPLEVNEFPDGGRDHPSICYGHHSPIDDVDPQATRSLFVGNIPKNISIYELRDIFQRFGDVLDVEIKKMGGNATYGFILYYDLLHAVRAKQCMDGQTVKGNCIRVGFGKGTPSKTLWIDGIDPLTTETQLERQIVKYGKVIRLGIDRTRHCAMVQYDSADSAKDALNSLKGSFIGNSNRLMTDFANRDARAAFFSRVEEEEGSGQMHSVSGPPSLFGHSMVNRHDGVMTGRGRIPAMGSSRGGYSLAGHPMDFYCNPYREEKTGFYGSGRPLYQHGIGPVHIRKYDHQGAGRFSQGFDDYEEELRAFSRKREWEREKEKHKKRTSVSPSSSDEKESKAPGSQPNRKRLKKQKTKNKGTLADDSEVEDSASEVFCSGHMTTHKTKMKRRIPKAISYEDEPKKRTLQVPRAGKCTESDEGMYKAGTTCNSDSDEKSPPSNDFKHSGLPSEFIELTAAIETPQSPVFEGDHGKVNIESNVSDDEELEIDTVATHSNETSIEALCHGQNTLEGVSTPGKEPDCKIQASKRPRLVPKQYQIDDEEGKRSSRLPEVKESNRLERHHPTPRSPSPRDHRRYRHSPSSQHGEKRPYQRDRPSSPGVCNPQHFSRSPPGYPVTPPHRHYSSPPFPRRRSPTRCRDRGPPRCRYESPPFDGGHGKCHQRESPPRIRYPCSPSPPPRIRSPRSHRFGWRRSPSFSPPWQSPKHISRNDKSPVQSRSQTSPYQSADDDYETSKGYGKKTNCSKTSSPTLKYYDSGKGDNRPIKLVEQDPKSLVPPEEDEVEDKDAEQLQNKQVFDHQGVCSGQKSTNYSAEHRSSCNLYTKSAVEQLQLEVLQPFNNLLDLLRRYPVMWQGHLTLKNDLTAVQLHFLSGNAELAKMSLPSGNDNLTPTLHIAQRMRLEKSQLDGVEKRIQNEADHCLLLALPCGKNADDVHIQTENLKNGLISYLLQKQAAGIISIQGPQGNSGFVLHIFPPCPFSQSHLVQVAPDLSSASDNCHLMIVAAMN